MINACHEKDKFALYKVADVGLMPYSLYIKCFDYGNSFFDHPWRLLATACIENGVL